MALVVYEDREFVFSGLNDYIEWVLEQSGRFYEENMLTFIHQLRLQGLYLDIGAFIGTHSVFFAGVCGQRVIAFEPSPAAYQALVANITFNVVVVDARQLALSSKPGVCTINTPKQKNKGSNYIIPGAGSCPMSTVDDEVKEPVVLIKIDVEGHELEVLKGAQNILYQYQPQLFIETTKNHQAVVDYLATFGYEQGQRFNATPTYHFYCRTTCQT